MPARIDYVGRAHELKVRYLLKPKNEYKQNLRRVLINLKNLYPDDYKRHLKRIEVGAIHSAKYISENIIKNKTIIRIDYTGEKNKGISDADLIVYFTDKSKSSISLKLYISKSFNLWNPTLETLIEHLTGKRFSNYLKRSDLNKYSRQMRLLKNPSVSSKSISTFWVKKAATILSEFNKLNKKIFRKNLRKRLGYASLIVAPIVDKNGLFKELISKHPYLIEQLAKGFGNLKIEAKGISINILLDKSLLTNFAVYAQSGSDGRSGGLRIATWTPYA